MTDAAGLHEYRHDTANRLIAAVHPNQPAESYSYDLVGNRTASHAGDGFVYDAADRLTSSPAGSFTYDRRGNLTKAPGAAYGYDELNRLVRTEVSGQVASYKYDPFGRRIEKSVGGMVTWYLYDRANILAEYDGAGSLMARHTHGPRADEPLVLERGAAAYFFQTDGLGSVRALTGGQGAIVETYDYDSFGNPVETSPGPGPAGNPFRFTGREWDSESGLYFYRSRHYDPRLGRFLQSDTFWTPARPETLNRYAYTANNPVTYTDPSGHDVVLHLPTENDGIRSPVPDGGRQWLVEDEDGNRYLIQEGSVPVRAREEFLKSAGLPEYQRPNWHFNPDKGVYEGPIGFDTETIVVQNVSQPGRDLLWDPDSAIRTIYDKTNDTVYQYRQKTIMGEYKPTFEELPPGHQTFGNHFKF
jgi:RHS repeat-associated protein